MEKRDIILYGAKLASWQHLIEQIILSIMAHTPFDMFQATNIIYSLVKDGATFQDLEAIRALAIDKHYLERITAMIEQGRHFASHPCGQLYVTCAYGDSVIYECLNERGPDIYCPRCNIPFSIAPDEQLENYYFYEVKHICGKSYFFYEKEGEIFAVNPGSGYRVTGCDYCGLPLFPVLDHNRDAPFNWTEYLSHKESYDSQLLAAIEKGRKSGHNTRDLLRGEPLEVEPIILEGEFQWSTSASPSRSGAKSKKHMGKRGPVTSEPL